MCTQKDPNNSAKLTHIKESSTHQAHGRMRMKMEETAMTSSLHPPRRSGLPREPHVGEEVFVERLVMS